MLSPEQYEGLVPEFLERRRLDNETPKETAKRVIKELLKEYRIALYVFDIHNCD